MTIWKVAGLAGALLVAAPASRRPSSVLLSTYLPIADCDGVAEWHGDAYLACHSVDSGFPIAARGPAPIAGTMGAYVLRLNLKSGNLIYATRIGGSAFTGAFRIKVDAQGFAYAAGFTKAPEFQTTPDAVQRAFGGGDSDAFVVKLTPQGRVVYSTLVGGSGTDQGNGLELDGAGGVLLGGTTWSSDFPGQHGPAHGGGDAFVAHLRPAEKGSLRSVVFGGKQEEKLTGLAVDGRGGLFAVGYTKSRDFPLAASWQPELHGVSDLFLTRIRMEDLAVTFSTYFGGAGDDSGWGVTVDRNGNPVVAGITNSVDLPTGTDAVQRTSRGGTDAFLAKFEGPGFRMARVTYFGGAGDDASGYDGDDLTVDAAGNVWLVGLTGSRDLPLRNAPQTNFGGGDTDGFLAAFSPQLTKLCFATYRGGSDRDLLEGVAVSPGGIVVATGVTLSTAPPMPARRGQVRVNSDRKPPYATVLALRAAALCQ